MQLERSSEQMNQDIMRWNRHNSRLLHNIVHKPKARMQLLTRHHTSDDGIMNVNKRNCSHNVWAVCCWETGVNVIRHHVCSFQDVQASCVVSCRHGANVTVGCSRLRVRFTLRGHISSFQSVPHKCWLCVHAQFSVLQGTETTWLWGATVQLNTSPN